MRGEERSRLLESDLSPRDASFAGLFLFLSFSLFFFHSLSLFLFRFETLLPAPGLASDVFHQINSRSMRVRASLHSAAPCLHNIVYNSARAEFHFIPEP